jgi:hypothetical protein
VADGFPGAVANECGVTVLDSGDQGPLPSLVTTRTLNWYAVALVSPVATQVRVPIAVDVQRIVSSDVATS